MAGIVQGSPGIGWVSIVQVGVSNPTPIPIMEVESADNSFKETTVPVENNEGEEIDSFVASSSATGKLVLKGSSAALLQAAVRGVTVSAGSVVGGQLITQVPTTPFQITVTPPNSGTFDCDLGVFNTTDGKKMTRGATSTGTNVYSVASNVYTFNTADAGDSIAILYRYTLSGSGMTAEIAQPTAGTAQNRWGVHVYKHTISGREWGFYIPYAQIEGLDESFKKGDWAQTTLSWKALPNGSLKKFYRYGQN